MGPFVNPFLLYNALSTCFHGNFSTICKNKCETKIREFPHCVGGRFLIFLKKYRENSVSNLLAYVLNSHNFREKKCIRQNFFRNFAFALSHYFDENS